MNFIGASATVLTIAAFMPQAFKSVRTRNTKDLSLHTYAILVVTGTLWTIYGLNLHSWELIVTNTVVALLALTICLAKLKHG